MFPWTAPTLAALLKRLDRLPHALLLHGPAGIGKLALAEAFCRFLLCESPRPNGACGKCDGCRWMAAGSHPDFRRLEPEALAAPSPLEEDAAPAASKKKPSTEIKVEQVRELADFLYVGSHRGKRRVVLAHPAEDMNLYAANALLKGLEEPPSGAMFVLVSHRPARLLPTIRSRCVAVRVPLPGREASVTWLGAQGVKDASRWLAFEGGAPLRALQTAEGAKAVVAMLEAAGRGDMDVLGSVDDREGAEALAEVLQKLALDKALLELCGTDKYGSGNARLGKPGAARWLAFAREMGQNRLLARHPLSPRLFAAEMLGQVPR